jgi:hypothetical protein
MDQIGLDRETGHNDGERPLATKFIAEDTPRRSHLRPSFFEDKSASAG